MKRTIRMMLLAAVMLGGCAHKAKCGFDVGRADEARWDLPATQCEKGGAR